MIVAMARVRITGPAALRAAAVALLQDVGAVHVETDPPDIDQVREEIPALRRQLPEADTRKERESLEGLLDQVRRIRRTLPLPSASGEREFRPPPIPFPRDPDEASLKSLSSRLGGVSMRTEALLRKRKIHEDELSLLARYDRVLRVLAPLMDAVRESRDLECTGLSVEAGEREIAALLEETLGRLTGGHYEIFFREVDAETVAGLLIYPAEYAAAVKALLWERNIGEIRLPASVADKPLGEAVAIIRRKRAELPGRIRRVDDELAALSRRWSPNLERLSAWLEDRIARNAVTASLYGTRMTFLLHGWIPRTQLDRLAHALGEAFGGEVVSEELPIERSDEERVPVVLANPAWARPYERLTHLLPLPRYGSIDPTPLMAVFFPLFYGIIIGDIGYGALLLGGALWARRRYRGNPLVRDAASIFTAAASSAIAWGIAYGEVFGDLGARLGLHPILLDRMGDFRGAIILVLAVGAGHITLGIALGLGTAIREGRRREIAAKTAGLLVVASALLAGAAVAGLVPRWLGGAGGAGVVAGLVLLLAGGGPSAAMELHNLVNVLSYLRLMGIGVASVALAYAANALSAVAGHPAIGIPAALALHAVNLVFGVVSPSVQSLRLHYVEFFENFYRGGGRAYKPFRSAA